jgi:hypothetical protein
VEAFAGAIKQLLNNPGRCRPCPSLEDGYGGSRDKANDKCNHNSQNHSFFFHFQAKKSGFLIFASKKVFQLVCHKNSLFHNKK